MTVSSEGREEGMLEGVVSSQPFPWLVDEQLLDQVKELLIFCVNTQHVTLQGKKKGTNAIILLKHTI